jgi:hypothetical protein
MSEKFSAEKEVHKIDPWLEVAVVVLMAVAVVAVVVVLAVAVDVALVLDGEV